MPSNKELGFDPKWNDEERLAWYVRKAREKAKDITIADATPKTPVHPFDIVLRACRLWRLPIYLDREEETISLSIFIDPQAVFPYRFLNLCGKAGIDIHYEGGYDV